MTSEGPRVRIECVVQSANGECFYTAVWMLTGGSGGWTGWDIGPLLAQDLALLRTGQHT